MAKLEMSPEILDALQKLSALLDGEDSFERTLDTVIDLSVSTLPGCDAAGVTVRNGNKDTTAASSDKYTVELDKIQYETNEGPCLTAIDTGTPHYIDTIFEETRWPEFCARAASDGLRSSSSFPLRINGDFTGALNLYSRSEHGFTEADRAIGEVFAKQANIALENARTYAAARQLSDQLNEALKTRDIIGQAKGILMEREGISDEAAFEMLRTTSQNNNVKLRDIALRLVEAKRRSQGR